jgi:hypothetical protein
MAGQVDLDAARAARAETNGEHPTVKFGDTVFELPIEMPFGIVESVNAMQAAQESSDGYAVTRSIAAIAQDLFGESYEKFMEKGPSMLDMQMLLENVAPLYGLTAGESQASEG